MLTVQKCCCFNLAMAGLIIGWSGIVGSVLSCFITSTDEVTKSSNHNDSVPHKVIQNLIMFEKYFLTTNSNYFKNIANIIVSVCLIQGTLLRKQVLLLPWLIKEAIALFVLTAFLMIGIFGIIIVAIATTHTPPAKTKSIENVPPLDNEVSTGTFMLILLVVAVLFSIFYAISVYLWIVVYSLYEYMRKDESSVRYVNSAGDYGESETTPLNQ